MATSPTTIKSGLAGNGAGANAATDEGGLF
jgi:hypothetical protein